MTVTIKNHVTDNYYIGLHLENSTYIVEVCPRIRENMCGYPIREMRYTINEKDKAERTFKRYIKKYI